jgi:hypothetical protein
MEKVIQELIRSVPYTEDLREAWEDFIENKAINSTFLHSRKFFDHNPLNANDDASLVFYKGGLIVAVLPACLYWKNDQVVLHAHLRATYGGFVVSKKVGVEEALQLVEQTIQFAKEKKAEQIIIRNPFRIFHDTLCDETDYAMWYHGFQVKSRELETAVELSENIEELRAAYHRGTRYSVKKSKKAVEVKLSEDFKEFWELLERRLGDRHGVKPVHDYDAICRLREKVGKENVLLFGAYHNNQLIGGNVVFNFKNKVLHGQYNASDWEFQNLMPLYGVVDYIIEWGKERGFKYFNMGTSNEDGGTKMNTGLLSYKESFGGRSFLRETMVLNV